MKELKYLDITKTNQGHIKVPSVVEMYPDMGAGRAEAIVTNIHDTDLVPYVFRKTPYNSTRESGDIVGASVAWNQLWEESMIPSDSVIYSSNSYTANGVTFTKNGDGTITVQTDANGATADTAVKVGNRTTLPVVEGNNVFFISAFANGSNSTYQLTYSNVKVATASIRRGINGGFNMWLNVMAGTVITTPVKATIQIIDLTLALGPTIADYIYTLESGTAGAGIAKLREWGFFDKPYYAYNAGAIESVNVSKHRMVGFNQWDEEWEVGAILNGSDTPTTTSIRGKNYCACFPNTDYYIKYITNPASVFVWWYDANKTFISNAALTASGIRTSPANSAYFRISGSTSYGATYNNDICINISGAQNGTYEPYTVHEYPLADITLRGILKLDGSNNLYADGDVYESSGKHDTNYKEVTLNGTENWQLHGSIANWFYVDDVLTGAYVNTAENEFAKSSKYLQQTYADVGSLASGEFAVGAASSHIRLVIKDTNYATADAFKTALTSNPVTIVYKSAAPTTETITGFTNPQVCSPYGTEQFIDRAVAAGTRDVAIPCGHETEYMKNIVGAIEGIPLPPTTNGNYKLRCTVASGVPTYSWVSE